MEEKKQESFISHLFDKKVPQYLGTYFAVGFGLLQFLEFVIKRYELTDSLTDKFLLVWLLLIPAIIILIYFNGKIISSPEAKVSKWPKFVVFGNVIIAFLLGGLLFNKVQAQSELVQLVDEEGKNVEVFVPDLNRIKTLACFQFINKTDDANLDWWGTAFSNLLGLSLNQWSEFYTVAQTSLNGQYDALGLQPYTVPSIGLQKEIAQKSRNDFFSRISFDIVDGQYVLKGKLYNTSDGTSIAEFNASNESPYEAIDMLASEMYDYYFAKLEGQKRQINIPSSSLISNNQEALKNFTLAEIVYGQTPNARDSVLELGKKSIELDPTCSFCYLTVGGMLYTQTKLEEAKPYINNAIKYGASLPKRFQFGAKEVYYSINNNIRAYIKLQELRRKMFPYEFEPYSNLQNIYLMNKGVDSTRMLMNDAIKNGNLEKGLLGLYRINLNVEAYDEAEKNLIRLTKEFPNREQDKRKFADLYQKQGKLDKAKAYTLELEALNPLDTRIQTQLAYLEFKSLDFDGAMNRINNGFKQASTLSDSLNFLWTKSFFYRRLGQIQNSLQTLEKYESIATKKTDYVIILRRTFSPKLALFQSTGANEKLEKLLTEIESRAPGQQTYYRCTANERAIESGFDVNQDADLFSDCINKSESLGQGYQQRYRIVNWYHLGEYDKCVQALKEGGEQIENGFTDLFMANMYEKNGMLEKAKQIMQIRIKQKTDRPYHYLRMAGILENEDPKEAKKQLDIALKFWSNADEDYIHLQQAKKLEARLAIVL